MRLPLLTLTVLCGSPWGCTAGPETRAESPADATRHGNTRSDAAAPDAAAPDAARQDADAQAARALVDAAPGTWHERVPAVLARGPSAARPLVAALRERPDAVGAQAAVATLGALGEPVAIPLLEHLLAEDGELGAEAAMALGRLPAPDCADALRKVVDARERSVLVRTAAAGALLDLGDDAAAPFLAAVLIAGTSYGADARRRHGIADKDRWAHERYVAIAAIERRTGETYGLHPDAPWPQLDRGAREFLAAVEGEGR